MENKFKIGDKVKVIEEDFRRNFCVSDILTILDNSDTPYCTKINTYDITTLKPTDYFCISEERLELVEESEVDHETHVKAHIEAEASSKQIGGDHYSKLKIQPMQYSLANNLNYAQANSIKYITRYKDKNGIEDLKKAIHCIELLIEFEAKSLEELNGK